MIWLNLSLEKYISQGNLFVLFCVTTPKIQRYSIYIYSNINQQQVLTFDKLEPEKVYCLFDKLL